jgi:hypothetical protein
VGDAFGIALAVVPIEFEQELSFVSKRSGWSVEMKRLHRFGTPGEASAIAAAQIRTLIDSMDRCARLLDYDIKAEEQRTGRRDCRDPTYSVLARSLTARRDNLAETIAALQKRLADEERRTYATVGWQMKLLQPA